MSPHPSQFLIDLVLQGCRVFKLHYSRGGSTLEPSDKDGRAIEYLIGPSEIDDSHLESRQHLDNSRRFTASPLDRFFLCCKLTDTLCQLCTDILCASFDLFECLFGASESVPRGSELRYSCFK